MTGPEHYRMAEQGLPLIHRETDGAWAIARAVESLVHATLALAAATALNNGIDGLFGDDLVAWERVAAENVSDVDPETGGIEDESLLPWERELLARTDVENLTAKERSIRAAAWSADAAAEDDELRAIVAVDPETGRDYAEEDDIRRQLTAEQEAEVAEEIQKLHGLEAAHRIVRSVRRGWAQRDAEDGAL